MDNIVKYFEGEKLQCIIGVVIALICISVSVYFLLSSSTLLKGISYVFIPLSLFLLAICVGVISRTSKDIDRISHFMKEEPEKIESEELPRTEKVMRNFDIIKKVEIAILLIGLILTVIFWRYELTRGVAIGLIIMGITLYLFDYIAESRGKSYIEFLKSI